MRLTGNGRVIAPHTMGVKVISDLRHDAGEAETHRIMHQEEVILRYNLSYMEIPGAKMPK